MNDAIVVLGEQGQVARELERLCREAARPAVFLGRRTLDLEGAAELPAWLDRLWPTAVINAAAFSGVDAAESQPEAAFALNRDLPGVAARACAERDLPFVHISSDYVFDGRKDAPYLEDDPRGPLNVYGRSKAEGEDAVAAAGGRWTTLRTSWVFGRFGTNFVKTMLRLANDAGGARVVDDQHGRPTWSRDVAAGALAAAEALRAGRADAVGLFHLAGSDDASWADVAAEVFRLHEARGGSRATLTRIATADYPTPAERPRNSRLDATRLREVLGLEPRPWRDSVARTLAAE